MFNATKKIAYKSVRYTGNMGIFSCPGSISAKEGKPYFHIHMMVGNPIADICNNVHLNRAIVSLTSEFILHEIDVWSSANIPPRSA